MSVTAGRRRTFVEPRLGAYLALWILSFVYGAALMARHD
jgi:hypothetical protein